MKQHDRKYMDIVVNIEKSDTELSILQKIYKELEFDDYIEYANLDGLNDLMQPDLFLDVRSLSISLKGWNKWKTSHAEFASSLIGVLSYLEDRWTEERRRLTINLKD